ncbi:MAG: protein kinase [Deltaproteobacteria bacterium]|nr:protein kinase [Deltaproteobacteria bacterium]
MTSPAADRGTQSPKIVEQARNFLSSLFMGLRTAHIHDPSNKAFEAAIRNVRDAGDALYASTGGFSIQFVEDSAFLNGQRIKFASGSYEPMRELRRMLESKALGGIDMRAAPTFEGVKNLMVLFIPKSELRPDAQTLGFKLLGVQTFSEGEKAGLKIDRRMFALQCFGKLILALREQKDRFERDREVDWGTGATSAPKLRTVRIVQDLIELTEDRLDFLLKLSAARVGASPAELHGANTCVISLALGHALGLARLELVEIGIAALFHDVARITGTNPGPEAPPGGYSEAVFNEDRSPTDAAFIRLLSQTGVAPATRLRSIIVAERRVRAGDEFPWGKPRPAPHVLSRIVGCASAYSGLTTGVLCEDRARRRPLDALAILMNDPVRVDPRVLDLLINVLRAYPVGCEVLLDDSRRAVVRAHRPMGRWDRPVVTFEDGVSLDLMAESGGRFERRIESTARYAGLEPKLEGLFRDEALEVQAEAVAIPSLAGEQADRAPELDDSESDDSDDLVLALPDEAVEAAPSPADTPPSDDLRDADFGQQHEDDDPFPSGSLDDDDMSPAVRGVVERVRANRELSRPAESQAASPEPFTEPDTPPEPLGVPPELQGWNPPPDSARPSRAPQKPESRPRIAAIALVDRFGFSVLPEGKRVGVAVEYRGLDPEDETPLSLRVLDKDEIGDSILPVEAQLRLFERECLLAARISHPGLPRLLDVGQSASKRYVAYERVDAETLEAAMGTGQISNRHQARRIVRSLAEALSHLHERGIVLCDLRPSKILLLPDFSVRIADLSMAMLIGEAPNPLLNSLPTLLAPEFLVGSAYEPRADQFALGCLFYQLLAGQPPWPGNWAVVDQTHAAPRPLKDHGPVIPDVVARMIERDPAKRYESCDTVARHLTRCVALGRRKPAG